MNEIITVLALIFAVGFAVLIASRRVGLPVIPALIVSGLFISPLIALDQIADFVVLGITFLVFYIGLRTDLDGFVKVSSDSLNLALFQVILVFPVGFYVAHSVGLDSLTSLYVALAASLASTLAGTDIFDRDLRMNLHHGQISTGANFIHDLIAVIMITSLAVGATLQSVQLGIIAALILLFAFTVRETLSHKIHSFVQGEELRLVLMVAVYGAAIGLAEITALSAILTSFTAGLMFSRGSETEEFIDVLEPLKDFFSVIMFVGLGALLTYPSVEVLKIAGLLVVLAAVLRPLLGSLVMLVDGHGGRKSFKTSLNMIQISEFALAAVIIGWTQGALSMEILEAVVVATATTMFISAFAARKLDVLYETVGFPLRKIEELLEYGVKELDIKDHIVLIGYDFRGQKIAEALEENFVVVDYSIENIELAKREGHKHIFGDIQDKKVVEAANISEADTVILTSDHKPVRETVKEFEGVEKILVAEESTGEWGEHFAVLSEKDMKSEALKNRVKELVKGKI